MRLLTVLALAATLASPVPFALAGDAETETLRLENGWTRATPNKAPAGGGFLTIHNSGAEADILLGGTSPAAKKVEVHEMKMEGDIMKMRPLSEGLPIPAGETVELKPGGLHIMLIGLSAPFKEGETVPVVLKFKEAGDVTIDLDVAKLGSKEMPMKHHDTHGAAKN